MAVEAARAAAAAAAAARVAAEREAEVRAVAEREREAVRGWDTARVLVRFLMPIACTVVNCCRFRDRDTMTMS